MEAPFEEMTEAAKRAMINCQTCNGTGTIRTPSRINWNAQEVCWKCGGTGRKKGKKGDGDGS